MGTNVIWLFATRCGSSRLETSDWTNRPRSPTLRTAAARSIPRHLLNLEFTLLSTGNACGADQTARLIVEGSLRHAAKALAVPVGHQ
jgi:hypothetical protein